MSDPRSGRLSISRPATVATVLLWILATMGIVIALLPGPVLAARRALVIGIDAYQNVPPLERAVGDAEAMAAKLSTLGFAVTKVLDPDRRALNLAITNFRKSLQPGDDALVHFSGHGVEIDGNNLLLPADIPLPAAGDTDFLLNEAIGLSDLMLRIAGSGAATQIFVIDACRDNPFAQAGTRGLGGTRGLVVVPPTKGSFVLYSAGTGQTALDTLGPGDPQATSVYTRVLIDAIGQPGLSLTDLAKTVRTRVSALASEVGHEQQPAYYDELNQDFYFVDAATPGGGDDGGAAPATPPPSGADTDARDFAAAQSINTLEAWAAFLQHHPTGYYADLAKAAIAALRAPPPPKDEPPPSVTVTPTCPAADGPWRVYDVPSSEPLNVRSGPGTNFSKIDALAFDASGLSVISCSNGWCEITHGCVRGYVSSKYISDQPLRLYHVVGHGPNEVLNMRRGPGTNFDIIGGIAYNASGIRLIACRPASGYAFKWCELTYAGVRGWAYGKYLQDDRGRTAGE